VSAIASAISQIQLGSPQIHANLTLFPLLGDGAAAPDYLLLDEALEGGCARVTEVSEAGSVPELRFVNECAKPVLLLDGEELVGAKQNRILNLSVLAPAGKTIEIPVSCVEAGRWHAQSSEFSSAYRAHYAAGRARKAADVSQSMRFGIGRRSDQGAVWEDIAMKAERMESRSPTSAAAAMYENHRQRLDDYRSAFEPVEGQVGALFAINGEPAGCDLFDSNHALGKLLPKLVESYALDAIDQFREDSRETHAEDVTGLIEAVAKAEAEGHPAVGQGTDIRLHGPRLSGGALADGGRIVHLCAFRLPEEETTTGRRGSRFASASVRRRARQ
jgi:hypothetical protein